MPSVLKKPASSASGAAPRIRARVSLSKIRTRVVNADMDAAESGSVRDSLPGGDKAAVLAVARKPAAHKPSFQGVLRKEAVKKGIDHLIANADKLQRGALNGRIWQLLRENNYT